MAGTNVGTAYLEIIPSAKGFAGRLQSEIGGDMESSGKAAGAKASRGFGGSFLGGLKSIAGPAAALMAGLGAVDFLKDSFGEAREAQKVGALTAQVIKTTGGAAKVTADQVGELAGAISNKTGIDDEAIQSASNLLLTFTNVRNEVGKGNDVFNQATQIATDMGAALGGDPKQSAIQLGKALNDPVKGVTALQKVGVSFTQQQKDQIKTLVQSGNTLGAQKIILGELNKEFGGAAAASATAGDKAAVAFGNLKESVGTALLPVLDGAAGFLTNTLLPAISGVVDGVKVFFDALTGNSEVDEFDGALKVVNNAGIKLREWITTASSAVKKFINEFKSGIGAGGKFRAVLEKIVGAIKSVVKWVQDNSTIVGSLTAAVLGAVAAYKAYQLYLGIVSKVTKAYAAVQALLNIVMAANPIGIVVLAIAALVAGFIYAYKTSETFRSYVSTAFSMVKIGALTLAQVAVKAFHFLANVFLTVVGAILDGAAAAFGWVPGIGPKLQGAADKFNTFKNDANTSLNAIENDLQVKINTEQANIALEALHREFISKGWTVTAEVNARMVYAGSGQLAPARASGGPVRAGMPYTVGDNPDGSWNSTTEVFVPDRDGTIYNQSQMGGLGSGMTRLHPHDIEALAAAIARRPATAVLSAGSADRALGKGVRR